MKKILRRSALVVLGLFVLIQFIRPERVNPISEASQSIQSVSNLSPEVYATLRRACFDCHSNETSWPWYSNLAPSSWLLANHVAEGRKHLNFSIWGQYNQKRVNKKLEEIGEMVGNGEMPLESYLLLHPEAKLTKEDIDLVVQWTATERGRRSSPSQ